jgi:hypothetical protein
MLKKNPSVVNINILVSHTDSCENNMQEVWVFGMKYLFQNKMGKSFCEFGKSDGCSLLQHCPNLILWAYVTGVKYLLKSVAY